MKTCFVNLPWEEEDRRGIRAGCRFPNLTVKNTNSYVPFPFLLAYAASYSEARGVDVLCIDGVGERCDLASVYERVERFAPDLLVAEISTTSLQYDLEALARIRSRLPQTRIAIYGSHVDVRPEDGLNGSAVDFVIAGEPERTAHELVVALTRGDDPASVAGLVRRGDDDTPVCNPRRPLIDDLDAIPYPRREGMPMANYNVPGFPPPVVFMYGSRGCPYKCSFCLWPQTNLKGKYRARSGEKIAAEIEHVLERYPETKSFFFDDDTFNLGRKRCLAFADEMKRRGIRIPWGMNARADNWDRELMERLIETGLFTLRIGIESGDQRILDGIRKGIDLEEARKTLELAHSLGLKNHVSFVIGLPGETPESVERTIRYIRSIPADSVQFSVAIPFPGTAFYRYVEENGYLLTRDWKKYNGFDHVVMRTETMSADDIDRAITRARRRVYFTPRFVLRRLSYARDLRDLSALTRKVWRLVAPRAS
jgi:radical SAM superfamily enzyme YgiQ (UPF0313 family)